MNTSLIIGLTGQTGAGKSSVCAALEKTGAAVINADAVAREVMKAKSPCLVSLAEAFGEDVLDKDGSLKRAVLAKKAFSDDSYSLNLSDYFDWNYSVVDFPSSVRETEGKPK